MVEFSKIQAQLSKVGYKTRLFNRAEVKELCSVLHEDEEILHATNGYYEGGFSLLVATDHRLLLVDRKPMFLTLDSIAYSMIQEVSFNYRLLNSTIHIYTSNKCLDFNSWNHTQIRSILTVTQRAMRELKNNKQAVFIHNGMNYEQLPMPELDADDVPDMPTPAPHYLNDNTQSAYDASSRANTLGVSALNLSNKDSKLTAIKTVGLSGGRYVRRTY